MLPNLRMTCLALLLLYFWLAYLLSPRVCRNSLPSVVINLQMLWPDQCVCQISNENDKPQWGPINTWWGPLSFSSLLLYLYFPFSLPSPFLPWPSLLSLAAKRPHEIQLGGLTDSVVSFPRVWSELGRQTVFVALWPEKKAIWGTNCLIYFVAVVATMTIIILTISIVTTTTTNHHHH